MSKEKRTFREVAQEWLEYQKERVSHASYSTYENRLKSINPIIGEFDVKDTQLILELTENSQRKNKERTKSSIMQLVGRVLEFNENGYEEKIIPKKKENIKLVSKEQFEVLKDYVLKDITPNNLGIICVMYTGLKISELCALKWSDVDLIKGVIKVRRNLKRISAYEGNESKTVLEEINITPRDIPIPTKLLRILLAKSMQVERYVASGSNTPVEPRTANYRLHAICKKLDIPSITYSNIRDYVAVNALANGINSFVLADIMGIEYSGIVKYMALAKEKIDPELEVEKLNNI